MRDQQGLLELVGFLLERFDLLAQVPLTLAHRGKIDLDGRDLPFGAILAARQRGALLARGSRFLVKLALTRRQLVLAVTELLDLGAACGRVLGNARATLFDLVLLLQLVGDGLLETSDLLAQAVGLAGNLRDGLRKLEVICLGDMQVVECLVDIALSVYDGLGRHRLLGLQLAQATLAGSKRPRYR